MNEVLVKGVRLAVHKAFYASSGCAAAGYEQEDEQVERRDD